MKKLLFFLALFLFVKLNCRQAVSKSEKFKPIKKDSRSTAKLEADNKKEENENNNQSALRSVKKAGMLSPGSFKDLK